MSTLFFFGIFHSILQMLIYNQQKYEKTFKFLILTTFLMVFMEKNKAPRCFNNSCWVITLPEPETMDTRTWYDWYQNPKLLVPNPKTVSSKTQNCQCLYKGFSFWTFLFVILLSFKTFVVTLRKYNACLSYNLNSSLIWKRKWSY